MYPKSGGRPRPKAAVHRFCMGALTGSPVRAVNRCGESPAPWPHGAYGTHGTHGAHGTKGTHGAHGINGTHGAHGAHGAHWPMGPSAAAAAAARAPPPRWPQEEEVNRFT